MAVHVFWDNSNIWLSAQNLCKLNEPGIPVSAMRISFHKLDEFVLNEREATTKVISGSIPPDCDSLWEKARRLGYDTNLLKRVESEEGMTKEQSVDESLHLAMANAILENETDGTSQIMILLSGDGRESLQKTSFPSQLQLALNHRWNVEVYSWENSFNRREFEKLVERYGEERVKIKILDNYYYNLVYIRGGDYNGCTVSWRGAHIMSCYKDSTATHKE